MRCGYEGKCFAFIHLHKTKTTCFGTDLVYTATRNDTLSQTKTTCFAQSNHISFMRYVTPFVCL